MNLRPFRRIELVYIFPEILTANQAKTKSTPKDSSDCHKGTIQLTAFTAPIAGAVNGMKLHTVTNAFVGWVAANCST